MTSRTFHDMVAVNNTDYVVSIHPLPFFQPPHYDTVMPSVPRIHLMPGHSHYYPNLQTRLYTTDTPYIFIPARNVPPISHCSPAQPTGTQSRPSSHNSDQSDISNLSASTGEKTWAEHQMSVIAHVLTECSIRSVDRCGRPILFFKCSL